MMNLALFATCICSFALVSCQISSTGTSVKFGGIDYYISPFSSGNVSVNAGLLTNIPGVRGLKPVSVVQEEITTTALSGLVSSWTAGDDVFQEGFFDAVFVAGAETNLTTLGNGMSSQILALDSSTIPSGPYFLDTYSGDLYSVYRLYDDFSGAFTESLLQTPQGTFQPLSAQVSGSSTLTVGVPSRLYSRATADKPLAGVRLAVKDIFDLAGVKTSNGNRAWYNLYPPANVTCTALQRLIDAGAIIVGKQKPSQFANGEQATADWVDYQSPFNPRGDGYQDPSSSSSGAGASIGSYPWLDIAIGSDTGGSIRGPSEVQGLFGLRPSHGMVSLDHVMPLSPVLDTAGFLTRDPVLLDTANSALYGDNYTSLASTKPAYPKKIMTYEFPTSASDDPSSAILLNFTKALAKFVGGNVTAVNLTSMWSAAPPAGSHNSSLSSYLNLTYPTLISKQQTALVRKPFYRDYAAVHNNRTPFVDPVPLARWAFGDTQPANALDVAIQNKTVFMNWFNSKIFPSSSNTTDCSSGLFLYIGSDGSQNSRNQYFGPPTAPTGFSAGRISVFAEGPDMVFPIGEVSSFSNVTQHEEYLPVTVDILAAKGCDGLLVKLAQDLISAGIIRQPVTGQTIYGGDVLMKREAELSGISKVRYVA